MGLQRFCPNETLSNDDRRGLSRATERIVEVLVRGVSGFGSLVEAMSDRG